MTKILALETATNACSVALVVGDEVISRHQVAPRQQSSLLLPMVDELLKTASLSIKELNAIAYGTGPGSFMGVRLAAGITQGLSFAADLPVIPVSTLQILAQTAYDILQLSSVIAGWDARMQQTYWGVYVAENGLMQQQQADQLSSPDAIYWQDQSYSLVGNAWSVYQAQLTSDIQSLSMHTEIYPQASSLIKLALVAYKQGETLTAAQVQPVYLRDGVAE